MSTSQPAGSVPFRAKAFRWVRLVLLGSLIVISLFAVAILPSWLPLLPRETVRAGTEWFLRAVLVFYLVLLAASLLGSPITGWLMVRAWKRGDRRSIVNKLFLLSVSCFVSLVAIELSSAVLRAWRHRLPSFNPPNSFTNPDEFRIVVIGGSSAMGEPFRPHLSVGQIVAWKLQEALPSRRFHLETLAFLGDSLEQQHLKLVKLEARPDLLVIYAGHNEFAARFEQNRDYTLAEESQFGPFRLVSRAAEWSPFRRLVRELVSKNRLDRPPLMTGRHQLIDPPLCSPSEYAEVLADFQARLETIIRDCERLKIVPVLIIPPANEADYEPSRSTLPPGVSQTDRDRLVRDFEAARSAEADDPSGSESRYREILARHPGFAEAHYRLGCLSRRANKIDEAKRHFGEALENDGLPIRCPRAFRETYPTVAARHPSCLLIDGRDVLMAASRNGLLGDDVIEDTHHPNLNGQAALAGAVLRAVRERKVFPEGLPDFPSPGPEECREHLGLGPAELAVACDRTSVHYERVAGYRYDPADRLRKSRWFAEAAAQIRKGVSPAETGLPGFHELTDPIVSPSR